jgi:hypothetical protein
MTPKISLLAWRDPKELDFNANVNMIRTEAVHVYHAPAIDTTTGP